MTAIHFIEIHETPAVAEWYIQTLYTSRAYSDTKPIQVHNVKNETLSYSMSEYFQDLSFQLNRRVIRRNYIEQNLDEGG